MLVDMEPSAGIWVIDGAIFLMAVKVLNSKGGGAMTQQADQSHWLSRPKRDGTNSIATNIARYSKRPRSLELTVETASIGADFANGCPYDLSFGCLHQS